MTQKLKTDDFTIKAENGMDLFIQRTTRYLAPLPELTSDEVLALARSVLALPPEIKLHLVRHEEFERVE